MIESIETGYPKVVGFSLCGKLHDEDYKQFVPRMETILTAEGKVRLFLQFDDFHGWDLRAAWDDLKFSLKHYADFERIAMVGDRKWEEWMASFCKPFTKAEVKYFDRLDVYAAWKWLLENDEDNRVAEGNDQIPDGSEEPDKWGTYPWYWS
ncbi:MAG: STAS/SEC14 domain-containing protein [Thermoguttaceae bacterium]|jgi:hypothetical protein